MAKNKKNKPDDVKIAPENEALAPEQTAPIEAAEIADSTPPPPEMTAEEAAALAHEAEAALQEIDNDGLEPSTPIDVSENIPAPEMGAEETVILEHGGENAKLPKMDTLKAEYQTLSVKKKAAYGEY
ncbi:hypothetical protein D3C76_1255330 [compost metagenome]